MDGRLLDALSDPIACFDEHLACTHVNPRFSACFGISAGDAAGRTPSGLWNGASGTQALSGLVEAALRLEEEQSVSCLIEQEGHAEKFEALALPRMNSEPSAVVLLLKPAERRGTAPTAGSQSSLAACNLVPMLQCQLDGRVLEANQAGQLLLDRDFAPRDLCWLDLVAPPHLERARNGLEQLRTQRRFGPLELDLVARSGKVVSVICSASRPEGSDTATFLLVDISERKYAEQAQAFIAEAGRVLASSLDFGKTLEQVAHLSVPGYADWCFVDIVEDENTINRVVVAHSEPAHGDLAGSLRRSYPLHRQHTCETRIKVAVDVVDLDLDAVAATHPFMGPLLGLGVKSYMVVPMVARQRLVGFLTFISLKWNYDHRNVACAEELARRAALCIDNARLYGEAQTASRVREEFLSAASHELKTPLTSLKLQVHSLLKMSHQLSGAGTDKLLHRIEGIGRQVERQCELVNVLLDVSRIHADRLVIEPEEFDLALLVRAIAARYDDDVGDARAKLKLRCPPELPVTLDRLRVDQVVTNLVSNAIKFGCGRPVDLDVTSAAEEIEIVVKDRGIGISPADRSRIFGRFERAVSHHNFGGFGLGLWITTQIVRAMGGSISVESTVDVGSTFTIRLPRQFQASP